MEPKQRKLADAEAALKKAEDNLAKKQQSLDKVQERLASPSKRQRNHAVLKIKNYLGFLFIRKKTGQAKLPSFYDAMLLCYAA